MFPWSPEFAWDAGHVIFFGALYCVLAAIAGALGIASWRATRALRTGRAPGVAWLVDFEDLPRSARACRHQLTGEAPGRVCENAFDCRSCAAHELFERRRGGDAAAAVPAGFDLPLDRYYHRGHTWARIEPDCTVSVGLDGIARRLLGSADVVSLPAAGERLQANGVLARLRAHGSEVRVLSPLDGTVVGITGDGAGFAVSIVPVRPIDLRHLLFGPEAAVWAVRELERLQAGATPAGAPALADGGELVSDVGAALQRQRYAALLADMLLEP